MNKPKRNTKAERGRRRVDSLSTIHYPLSTIRWPARPKRDDTLVARRRVWTTKCRRYRVVHSHILYGGGVLADRFYAEVFDPHVGGWQLLNWHRTKHAAIEHCEREAKESREGAKAQRSTVKQRKGR